MKEIPPASAVPEFENIDGSRVGATSGGAKRAVACVDVGMSSAGTSRRPGTWGLWALALGASGRSRRGDSGWDETADAQEE